MPCCMRLCSINVFSVRPCKFVISCQLGEGLLHKLSQYVFDLMATIVKRIWVGIFFF